MPPEGSLDVNLTTIILTEMRKSGGHSTQTSNGNSAVWWLSLPHYKHGRHNKACAFACFLPYQCTTVK